MFCTVLGHWPPVIAMINFPEKRGSAAIILYYQNIRVNRLGPPLGGEGYCVEQ